MICVRVCACLTCLWDCVFVCVFVRVFVFCVCLGVVCVCLCGVMCVSHCHHATMPHCHHCHHCYLFTAVATVTTVTIRRFLDWTTNIVSFYVGLGSELLSRSKSEYGVHFSSLQSLVLVNTGHGPWQHFSWQDFDGPGSRPSFKRMVTDYTCRFALLRAVQVAVSFAALNKQPNKLPQLS
jgi:hypothetical protein